MRGRGMISYEERLESATGRHNQGMLNVKNNPEPEGQKFPNGSRVRICKDLGSSMSHFESDCNATVQCTHAHAYGGNDVKSYALNVDGHGSSAWYEEWQLTAIEEKEIAGESIINELNHDFTKAIIEAIDPKDVPPEYKSIYEEFVKKYATEYKGERHNDDKQ